MIKKFKDWHTTLEEYLKPNDEIDEEMYWYFLGVLPPVMSYKGIFQPDEPWSHNSKGQPLYDTFEKIGERYFYRGHLPTNEAKELILNRIIKGD